MDEALQNLFDNRPHLAQRTRDLYSHNINQCLSSCGMCEYTELCNNSNEIIEYIDSRNKNSAKLCVTGIIALMKENKASEEQIMPYVKKYKELNEYLRNKAEEQTSDKDFATLDEIRHVEQILAKRVKERRLFQKEPQCPEDLDMLMNLLMVRVHLDIPLRNELPSLKITSKVSDTYKGNWLFTNPYTIVLNDYKTSKKYGRKEYRLPIHISRLCSRVAKYSRCNHLFYLPRHPEKPLGSQYYHHKFKNIFIDTIGKSIASSAVRKAHVTELYKGAPSIKERQKLASIMNHTPETAELHYYKIQE